MDVQRTRSLQGDQVADGPILEDRRIGQAAPFVLKLVLKRALAADMQPDLIPMEATFDGADDGCLVLLVRETTDGDDMDKAIIEALALSWAERLGHAIGYDMELTPVAMLAQLVGDHLARTMDMADVAVEPVAKQPVDGIANQGRCPQVRVVGGVLRLQVKCRRHRHTVGSPPIASRLA